MYSENMVILIIWKRSHFIDFFRHLLIYVLWKYTNSTYLFSIHVYIWMVFSSLLDVQYKNLRS